MEALLIDGGRPLKGCIAISGSKNAALPILAATVAHGAQYTISRCPAITDVALAGEIIEALGGSVSRRGDTLRVDTRNVRRHAIPGSLMGRMRASVLFLGALLTRFGAAALTMPGGCPLGRRPIDLHLDAVARMGTSVVLREGSILCEAPALHGAAIELLFPSVGATENVLLTAVGCGGTVVLQNAAREPEIEDLGRFLQAMGADIAGLGTDTITIRGGAPLHGASYTVMADRIETATFLCACAGCGGDVALTGTDGKYIGPVLDALTDAGCEICRGRDTVTLRSEGRLRAVSEIATAPYPGFPTDVQAPMMAALLRARGESRFAETIFERRFAHVAQLRKFGAEIEVVGAGATVRGVEALRPALVEGTDLRGAASLVLAALQAPGESAVTGINHLRRGYDKLEEKLRALGASICTGKNPTGNFPSDRV